MASYHHWDANHLYPIAEGGVDYTTLTEAQILDLRGTKLDDACEQLVMGSPWGYAARERYSYPLSGWRGTLMNSMTKRGWTFHLTVSADAVECEAEKRFGSDLVRTRRIITSGQNAGVLTRLLAVVLAGWHDAQIAAT